MVHVSIQRGLLHLHANEADLACFERGPPQGRTALLMPSHCLLEGGGPDRDSGGPCFKKGGRI